jgi:hypothetical protein
MKDYIYVGCLLGLLYDIEDVGSTLLGNVSENLQDCTGLHPGRYTPHNQPCENFEYNEVSLSSTVSD